jgi:hypothetical protein
MGKLMRGGLVGLILRFASGLRFPWLFALTAVLFVVNVFIPDTLPLADEMLMGLVALLLASLKKKSPEENADVDTGAATASAGAAIESDGAAVESDGAATAADKENADRQ